MTYTAENPHADERVCCLLVLDSITSTPQWMRHPKSRDVVYDVCVYVYTHTNKDSESRVPYVTDHDDVF